MKMKKEEFEAWAENNHWLLITGEGTVRAFRIERRFYVWLTPSGKK